MSSITLVISDIDGTLITSNHEVTEATKAAAHALNANGIKLSLASSRPPRAIIPIASQIGLDSNFAAFNGALILTSQGETLAESFIQPEVSLRIRAIADEYGLDVWLYDATDWWAARRTQFVEREEHTSGFEALLTDYAAQLRRPLNKLTVVGQPDLVAKAELVLIDELGEKVSASRSKPRFLDVTAFGWHKGSVVGRFSDLLNTCPADVAVIGDGPNDVEMFAAAGLSIAMGQAVDEVRRKASVVTTSNDDEGWANAMNRYILGTSGA